MQSTSVPLTDCQIRTKFRAKLMINNFLPQQTVNATNVLNFMSSKIGLMSTSFRKTNRSYFCKHKRIHNNATIPRDGLCTLKPVVLQTCFSKQTVSILCVQIQLKHIIKQIHIHSFIPCESIFVSVGDRPVKRKI